MVMVAKKALVSATLGLGVFCIFYVAAPNFGGLRDDFGDLVARNNASTSVKTALLDGRVNSYLAHRDGSYNFVTQERTDTDATGFFSAYYRPVALWVQICIFKFWGDDFLAHYRLNVIIHALSTMVFFLMASLFSSLFCAWIFSLLFAFHPVHGMYFGHASNLQYYLFVLLFLLMTWLLWHFMQTGLWRYLAGSWVLYLLVLGCRETALAAPGALVVFFGALFYRQRNFMKRIIPLFCSFAFVDLLFLCWRLYLYPIIFHGNALPKIAGMGAMHKYLGLLHLLVYDVLGASDIAYGAHVIKYAYLLLVGSLIVYAWYCAADKLKILGVACAASLLLLPSFAMAYHPRHLYDALPYVLFGFVLLASAVRLHASMAVKKFLAIILVLLVLFKGVVCIANVYERARHTAIIQEKIKELAAMPGVQQASALCILAYPALWFFTFMDLSVQYYAGKNKTVLIDKHCAINCFEEALALDIGLLRRCTKTFVQAQMYLIKRTGNNVMYTFFKPQRADVIDCEEFASGVLDEKKPLSAIAIGHWQLVRDDAYCKQYQLVLRDELMQMQPIFIAWNPKEGHFEIC